MFIALLRYLHAWRRYGIAVRELSNLDDHELADLVITRSDVPRIAYSAPQAARPKDKSGFTERTISTSGTSP